MNPEDHAESAGPSELPYFLIKEVLPVDLIIYLGNFMKSKDYASFIRGLWPNHDEDELIRAKLWKKSTHRLHTEFVNGKHLEIEYNFEHTTIDEERILINVNSLLPVFGGRLPPDTETFVDVVELKAFVETHVHLNECNDQRYASCPCHLDVDSEAAGAFKPFPVDACADGHFHHFCFRHVNFWLSYILEPAIKDLEEGSFDGGATSYFAVFVGTTVYFRDGKALLRSSHQYRIL